MADTIKCGCSNCGAKYRLPLEAQGRKARCKRCGNAFDVPRADSMEDTILTWLAGPEDEEEEAAAPPRVISMPTEATDEEVAKKIRGPIRLKSDAAAANK